jgi:hypothetical protein
MLVLKARAIASGRRIKYKWYSLRFEINVIHLLNNEGEYNWWNIGCIALSLMG